MRDELKNFLMLIVEPAVGVFALIVIGFMAAAVCVVGYAALCALGTLLLGGC